MPIKSKFMISSVVLVTNGVFISNADTLLTEIFFTDTAEQAFKEQLQRLIKNSRAYGYIIPEPTLESLKDAIAKGFTYSIESDWLHEPEYEDTPESKTVFSVVYLQGNIS